MGAECETNIAYCVQLMILSDGGLNVLSTNVWFPRAS